MKCDDARRKLSALLDGAVEASLRDAIARHVDGCGACRAEWGALAGTDGVVAKGLATAVASAPPASYFEEFWPRLSARLDAERREVDAMAMSTTGSEDPRAGDRPKAQGGGPSERNEVSGLHDIRALARSTIQRHQELHPEDLGEVVDSLLASASPASLGQVLLPEPGREVRPAAVVAVEHAARSGGGGWGKTMVFSAAVLIAGGAVAFVMHRNAQKHDGQQALAMAASGDDRATGTSAPAAPAQVTPIAAERVDPATVPAASADQPKTEEGAVAGAPGAVADAPADRPLAAKPPDKGAVIAARDKAKDKEDKGAAPGGAPPPADKATPPAGGGEPALDKPADKPADKPKGGEPTLDDILGAAPPPVEEPEEKPAPAPTEDLPEKLSPDQIKKGMKAVNPRVGDCYSRYKVPGTVKIKVKIDPDGTVSSAIAIDKFANTETGFCVAEAVVLAKFPKFSGPPMQFPFPFKLQ